MTDDAGAVRRLVDGVNRGDIAVADEVFARDCVVHITGRADPMVGKAISLVGLILDHFVDGRIKVRWEQYDQPLALQQMGVQ